MPGTPQGWPSAGRGMGEGERKREGSPPKAEEGKRGGSVSGRGLQASEGRAHPRGGRSAASQQTWAPLRPGSVPSRAPGSPDTAPRPARPPGLRPAHLPLPYVLPSRCNKVASTSCTRRGAGPGGAGGGPGPASSPAAAAGPGGGGGERGPGRGGLGASRATAVSRMPAPPPAPSRGGLGRERRGGPGRGLGAAAGGGAGRASGGTALRGPAPCPRRRPAPAGLFPPAPFIQLC